MVERESQIGFVGYTENVIVSIGYFQEMWNSVAHLFWNWITSTCKIEMSIIN